MSTLAVGDVQGCCNELYNLLRQARFDAVRDRLWFVGDLVNRGPQSLEVLRFVRGLGDRAVTVLGNHDLHLLAQFTGHVRPRPDDTLEQVLAAPDASELVDWLRARPLLHAEGQFVLVHAGLLPQWSIDQAAALAREVEDALRSPHYRDFVAAMYGSRPDRWEDRLQGFDRLRVIVNAMTRMRFCTPAGVMEFQTKGETAAAPPGYVPWFEAPGRRSAGSIVICGHWSALGLRVAPDLMALDSGCVWGGKLSAVRLEDGKLFQVPCRGAAPSP
jgi:bis(5'-nucleosyl)-tetraphosphatase (symmetrical)